MENPTYTEDLRTAQEIGLPDMLEARERRSRRQNDLRASYPKCAMVCFTMNIVGPVKNSPLIRRGFLHGCALFRQQLMRLRKKAVHEALWDEPTGNEGYFMVDLPAIRVKRLTAEIGMDFRRCAETGTDFTRCGETGMCRPNTVPTTENDAGMVLRLREAGAAAERDMLSVTGGVNTHKGAIFSMGIVCAALGRMDHSRWSDPEAVLAESGRIAAALAGDDFAKLDRMKAGPQTIDP